ncbi:MAG: hypothetical protein E6Q97_00480 [Desulfurellales bacterium]|nr:MAG: hypothetical protein E6Q97_00480 [Desulfurellales bacterium]
MPPNPRKLCHIEERGSRPVKALGTTSVSIRLIMNRFLSFVLFVCVLVNAGLTYRLTGDTARVDELAARLDDLTMRCARNQFDFTECDEFVLKTQKLIIMDLKRLDANQKQLIAMAMKNEEVTQ